MAAEVDGLRGDLDRLGVLGVAELERRRSQLRQEIAEQEQEFRRRQTEDVAILQEVGLYEARHPLTDAAAYQAELARLQQARKAMARKDGGAVEAATDWTVNGSARSPKRSSSGRAERSPDR